MSDSDQTEKTSTGPSVGAVVMSIFQTIVWIAAIFMAIRCRGFDPFHLIVAFCCPYCYIPYGLYCLLKGDSNPYN